MLEGNTILVIGARAGGYGASIAYAAASAGAEVYGTTLNPEDAREQEFFKSINVKLLDVPLKFDVDKRSATLETLKAVQTRLRDHGFRGSTR
jgi:NAD(P)-dependent dehydrogenase (short-subunit alcohol dehydrogenase family)